MVESDPTWPPRATYDSQERHQTARERPKRPRDLPRAIQDRPKRLLNCQPQARKPKPQKASGPWFLCFEVFCCSPSPCFGLRGCRFCSNGCFASYVPDGKWQLYVDCLLNVFIPHATGTSVEKAMGSRSMKAMTEIMEKAAEKNLTAFRNAEQSALHHFW